MSIQIDNGEFTRIHNDILAQLAKTELTAWEYRCLFFLIRMTYGWQKKEDAISLSQWAHGIGVADSNRGNILNTLNGLVRRGIIYTRSNGNNRPATWGLNKAYFESQDNAQTVMHPHNSADASVMQPDNTTVMQPHNKTVMQPHNHQRKERNTKEKKDTSATQPAKRERTPTPQQELFGAVCEAIGWDHRTLSKDDKGQVAQAVGILQKADYTVEDVRRFMVDIWFRDWRWTDKAQRPTLKQIRQEIGKIRAGVPKSIPRNGNGSRASVNEQEIEEAREWYKNAYLAEGAMNGHAGK